MKDVFQVIGLVMLIVGAQGAVRLAINHNDGGLLHWLPGGFGTWMTAHVILVVIGVIVATWGNRKAAK